MYKNRKWQKPFIIDAAVSKVAMRTHIPEAEDRVWSLHEDYKIELRIAGYGDLTVSKSPVAMKYFMKWLKPQYLKTQMQDIIRWRKKTILIERISALSCARYSNKQDGCNKNGSGAQMEALQISHQVKKLTVTGRQRIVCQHVRGYYQGKPALVRRSWPHLIKITRILKWKEKMKISHHVISTNTRASGEGISSIIVLYLAMQWRTSFERITEPKKKARIAIVNNARPTKHRNEGIKIASVTYSRCKAESSLFEASFAKRRSLLN